MIEHLFGSKTRVKLLHLFYTNPNRSFYVREITRKIDEQINSVRRELGNLQKIGIIKSDNTANRLYYEVNQAYQHYHSMKAMFTGVSASQERVVAESDITQRFRELGSVQLVILTGNFVRREAPVDILIVGDVNRNKLEKLVSELEVEEGKELRYTIFTPEEYQYRFDLNDFFLTTVLEQKHTRVIDELRPPLVAKETAEQESKTKKKKSPDQTSTKKVTTKS